ncbi:unnamed protein product [Moneuplotes crassus]|uniref:tRNA modification GTPase TrmE n=1 Tax=Euplotes crassus TaxID=5936 RepID=A0AAD1U1X6_EUPCR|nr:unnamed protein product [Moneuplotes crassus]
MLHRFKNLRTKQNFLCSQIQSQKKLLRYFSTSFGIDPTIYSVITGFGKSAVAIIRVSGRDTYKCLNLLEESSERGQKYLESLTKDETLKKYRVKPRYSHYRSFYDIFSRNWPKQMDSGLLIYNVAPHSFTGEDTVEFHLHGSMMVKQLMLRSLSKFPNYRQAEPGEFTKRAMFNGKLDALKAEAINDLINAESENQHYQSIKQLGGRHSLIFEEIREEIIKIMAHAEAFIEFEEDEDDVEQEVMAQVSQRVKKLLLTLKGYLDDNGIGEIIREGVKIAIAGPPNAGKSSLINELAKSDVAIVSDIPGTTRDPISVNLNISLNSKENLSHYGSQMVTVTDTAGLRSTENPIEKMGISKTLSLVSSSQCIYLLSMENLELVGSNFKVRDLEVEDQLLQVLQKNKEAVLVVNKVDLIPEVIDVSQVLLRTGVRLTPILCSVTAGTNLKDVHDAIKNLVSKSLETSHQDVIITRERHRVLLEEAVMFLERFLKQPQIDMVEELRIAMYSISKILGHIDIEEIYDTLFHDFCIGK